MSKNLTRESGFVDRFVIAAVAMGIGAALAVAAESGLKPAAAPIQSAAVYTDPSLPQGYVVADNASSTEIYFYY